MFKTKIAEQLDTCFPQAVSIKMSLPTLKDYPMAWGVSSVRQVIMYPRMLPQEEPSQSVFYVLKVGERLA